MFQRHEFISYQEAYEIVTNYIRFYNNDEYTEVCKI